MNINKFNKKIVFIFFCGVIFWQTVFCEQVKENNLVLDKNFIFSVQNFVRDNYENSKFFCNNFKNKVYIKTQRNLINCFYLTSQNNGAMDYTFVNISREIAKSVLGEYLACRVKNESNKFKNYFDWCACRKARASTRLYLVFDILNKLSGRDKKRELVYVSFGSGKLLQDYLIIKGLVAAGFKNININLIDLGYANSKNNINNGIDIDSFLKTFCRKQGENCDEKDSLCAFCKLIKSCKSVKKINSYTTYFDFLQQFGKNKIDILLLIDPMKLFAELLDTKELVYVNHVRVKSACEECSVEINRIFDLSSKSKNCDWEIIFLLPYAGRPEVFYKAGKACTSGYGCFGKFTKSCLSPYLLHSVNSYKSYKDRANFIKSLDLCLNWPPIWPSKLCDLLQKKNIIVGTSQSQRYSFYDIIKSTVSKNALIYQLDENKIFLGERNLLTDAYKKEGYLAFK